MTQTDKICEELQKIIDGSILMGATPYPLIAAKKLLIAQQSDLKEITSSDPYKAGYIAGRIAAFETGLVGDT